MNTMSAYVYVFLGLNSDKVRENTYGAFDWIDGPTTSAFWAPPFWRSLESSRPTKPNKNISQYFIPSCNSRAHNTQGEKNQFHSTKNTTLTTLFLYFFFYSLTERKIIFTFTIKILISWTSHITTLWSKKSTMEYN